jgi:hypothetical protein
MYFVKTRNWHCKQWVKFFLDISHVWGVKRGDYYDDGDGKYILETSSNPCSRGTEHLARIFETEFPDTRGLR